MIEIIQHITKNTGNPELDIVAKRSKHYKIFIGIDDVVVVGIKI